MAIHMCTILASSGRGYMDRMSQEWPSSPFVAECSLLCLESHSYVVVHKYDQLYSLVFPSPSLRRVIHVVGPRYTEKYATAAENSLSRCYRACLELLVESELCR